MAEYLEVFLTSFFAVVIGVVFAKGPEVPACVALGIVIHKTAYDINSRSVQWIDTTLGDRVGVSPTVGGCSKCSECQVSDHWLNLSSTN